jgi:putative hydrolase of the HAD superfamily
MPRAPTRPAVVFDLGKVLLDFDYGRAARRLAARSAAGADEVRRVLDQSPLLFRYETGELSTPAFFQEVRGAIGFRGGLADFGPLFADIFSPIDAMVDLPARLRSGGVPVFVFSNTNELAVTHIRAAYPFFSGFDGYVYSYEHAAMKPTGRIYQAVERITERPPEDLIYLDDRPENVAAGANRGWHTILHQDPVSSIARIEELLGR